MNHIILVMDTARVARELLDALDRGKTVPSIVGRYPGFDWDEAYGVLAEILKLRRARGEKTVGRKIGFTNRNIWAQYGATAPIWAHVYDKTRYAPPVERRRKRDACESIA
jgi:2-oxo-3-hexenedioate decarboxylase